MKTKLSRKLGIEVPIFAFSHCRDVVAAASRVGGLGVFGAARYTAEELETELAWIDAHCDGKPYGVDILFPASYDRRAEQDDVDPRSLIPEENIRYFENLMESEGVPPLPTDLEEEVRQQSLDKVKTRKTALRQLEIALRHENAKLIVNALGAPEPDMVRDLHDKGILVGALVGSPRHAERQLEAGVDVLVAQGTEAAGHTGRISTLVLVPQIVQMAGDRAAVLAAGGIVRGEQMIASLAMGAQGVWCGTIWLTSTESELIPEEKERLFQADSSDTMQVKYRTGKPVRIVSTKIGRLLEEDGAPKPLKAPLQELLFDPFKARIMRAKRFDLNGPAGGQGVGMLHWQRSVRQIFMDMTQEAAEALERIEEIVSATD